MTEHQAINELLSAYACGDVASPQKEQVQAHVQSCRICQQELEQMRLVLSIADSMRGDEVEAERVEQAEQSVLSLCKQRAGRSSGFETIPWNRWIIRLSGIAAMLLLVVLIAWTMKQGVNLGEPNEGSGGHAPYSDLTQTQLAQALAYYDAQNTAGLIELLQDATQDAQITVAGYLAQLKATEALPLLHALAATWDGDPQDNPFAQAAEEILAATTKPPRGRVEAPKPAAPIEPNTIAEPGTQNEPNKPPPPITVAVIDSSGNPLPGVSVKASSAERSYYRYAAVSTSAKPVEPQGITDVNGLWVWDLSKNAPKSAKLELSKTGHIPLSVDLPVVSPGAVITTEMDTALSIGGTIVDEQGVPIEGVKVQISASDPNRIKDSSLPRLNLSTTHETDINGFWLCEVMPDNVNELFLQLSHPDYSIKRTTIPQANLNVYDLLMHQAVFTLEKGQSCSGSVMDSLGNPIEKAYVLLGFGYPDFTRTDFALTDANGIFDFPDVGHILRKPNWGVLVAAKGYAPKLSQASWDSKPDTLQFILDTGRTVTGKVKDEEGKPIKGATVNVQSWEGGNALHRVGPYRGKTDEHGRFVMEQLPVTEITLEFQSRGYCTAYQVMTAGDDQVNAVLLQEPTKMSTRVEVEGRVYDQNTGQPIERFHVVRRWLKPENEPNPWKDIPGDTPWYHVTSRPGGVYSFPFSGSTEGYRFIIYAQGYIPFESRVIRPDEKEVSLDVYLQPGMGPGGQVLNRQGQAIPHAEVYLLSCAYKLAISNGHVKDKAYKIHVKSDHFGWFEFTPQYKPKAFIAISDYGFGWATQQELDEQKCITVHPWSRLTGTSQLGSRHPVRLCRLAQDPLAQYIKPVNLVDTDPDGWFEFERLMPGKFRLGNQGIDISAGQNQRIVLAHARQTVTGQLTDAQGAQPSAWDPHLRLLALSADANEVDFAMLQQLSHMPADQLKQYLGQAPESPGIYLMNEHRLSLDRAGRFWVNDLDLGHYVLCAWIEHRDLSSKEHGSMIGRIWCEFDLSEPNPINPTEPVDLGTFPLIER